MAQLFYATVGSNDLEAAKAYFDQLMPLAGLSPMMEHPSGGRIYRGEGGMFGVLGPFDGNAASVGNGSMIGFSFDTREEVDAFYNKAIELGGTDEGAPGERAPGVYFSYFRDPDGNKFSAFKFG